MHNIAQDLNRVFLEKADSPFSFEASNIYWRLVNTKFDLSASDVECVLLFATAMAEASSEQVPVTRSKLFVLMCVCVCEGGGVTLCYVVCGSW